MTSGRDKAARSKAVSQWPNSVASVFKNLRRAGVLKYKSLTSIMVPISRAAGSIGNSSMPLEPIRQACLVSVTRLLNCKRETDAILARASPRKPKLATLSKSSKQNILLVAWRVSAMLRLSWLIPTPLSVTFNCLIPPCNKHTLISVAPASRLFSSISFNADAGRSTTSPAAIWLIS